MPSGGLLHEALESRLARARTMQFRVLPHGAPSEGWSEWHLFETVEYHEGGEWVSFDGTPYTQDDVAEIEVRVLQEDPFRGGSTMEQRMAVALGSPYERNPVREAQRAVGDAWLAQTQRWQAHADREAARMTAYGVQAQRAEEEARALAQELIGAGVDVVGDSALRREIPDQLREPEPAPAELSLAVAAMEVEAELRERATTRSGRRRVWAERLADKLSAGLANGEPLLAPEARPRARARRLSDADFWQTWRCNRHRDDCFTDRHMGMLEIEEEAGTCGQGCHCWRHRILRIAAQRRIAALRREDDE